MGMNVPLRSQAFEYLAPGGGNASGGLGGGALLEEAHHWKQALRAHSLVPLQYFPQHSALAASCHASPPGGLIPSEKLFLLYAALIMVFHQNSKN